MCVFFKLTVVICVCKIHFEIFFFSRYYFIFSVPSVSNVTSVSNVLFMYNVLSFCSVQFMYMLYVCNVPCVCMCYLYQVYHLFAKYCLCTICVTMYNAPFMCIMPSICNVRFLLNVPSMYNVSCICG